MAVSLTQAALDDVRAATLAARRGAAQQAMAVRAARIQGVSWRELGELFGVSQQAAHNRWSSYCSDIDTSGLNLPRLRTKSDRWLTAGQVASMLGIDLTTWRVMPAKPRSSTANGAAYFRQSDVLVWIGAK
jgi:hypothetical protein